MRKTLQPPWHCYSSSHGQPAQAQPHPSVGALCLRRYSSPLSPSCLSAAVLKASLGDPGQPLSCRLPKSHRYLLPRHRIKLLWCHIQMLYYHRESTHKGSHIAWAYGVDWAVALHPRIWCNILEPGSATHNSTKRNQLQKAYIYATCILFEQFRAAHQSEGMWSDPQPLRSAC